MNAADNTRRDRKILFACPPDGWPCFQVVADPVVAPQIMVVEQQGPGEDDWECVLTFAGGTKKDVERAEDLCEMFAGQEKGGPWWEELKDAQT